MAGRGTKGAGRGAAAGGAGGTPPPQARGGRRAGRATGDAAAREEARAAAPAQARRDGAGEGPADDALRAHLQAHAQAHAETHAAAEPPRTEAQGGIQSLDRALHLLHVLARLPGPVALGDLARAAGMPSPKAHRYLASFLHAGLAVSEGGRYDLGPGAIAIGLAALARHDVVNATASDLPRLTAESGLTALLSVWGSGGPTVVRWERAPSFVATSLGLGTTFPLLSSATGRAFLAHLPEAVVAPLRQDELARLRASPRLIDDIDPKGHGGSPLRAARALAAEVRKAGFASVDSRFIPGLAACAAPVLNWQGEAEAVVTLIGTDPRLIEPQGPTLRALRRFCARHSIPPPEGAAR